MPELPGIGLLDKAGSVDEAVDAASSEMVAVGAVVGAVGPGAVSPVVGVDSAVDDTTRSAAGSVSSATSVADAVDTLVDSVGGTVSKKRK